MRICYCFAFFLILNFCSATAQPPLEYPATSNLSTTWANTEIPHHSVYFADGSMVRAILLRGSLGPKFSCGFFCNGTCTSYLFAVFIVQTNSTGGIVLPDSGFPQIVWSANRDHPVSYGAILNLTETGELVLQDVDASTVWTTNTSGKSVAGLNLTDDGNLVLFDVNSSVVWQSFDHPTDSLVLGQKLFQGQQLIPSVSSTNWTTQKGLFSLQVTDKGLFAYVGSNQHQAYYSVFVNDTNKGRRYVRLLNGSLSLFILSAEPSDPYEMTEIPRAPSVQYIKLMPDGHLKVFEWQAIVWLVVADLFKSFLEGCKNPLACGRNALCSGNQQCRCLDYFSAVDYQKPKMDCINPLTYCDTTQIQYWPLLENVTYFNIIADMEKVDVETCKQACVNNCSCTAAIFQYGSNSSSGDCFLPDELFTMMIVSFTMMIVNSDTIHRNISAFIKVHAPYSNPYLNISSTAFLIFTLVGFLFPLGVIGFLIYKVHKPRRTTQMEEEPISELPGMPSRFPYEELKTATENFNKKLGEGGFGAVFEGTLEDGSKIAVKCLEGLGPVNKSFIAEVRSIGSIHHVNLVRLRGFCAWKSQRFLVYEYMSNGSLDRWIYHGDREHELEWECRKKIILDVAKGLAYLHDDCRQKIIHLDIKPQNILLDSDFNAKVSDFGLSKLIDRNQTQVMTTMRGTPGYLAPEWLSSVITEKVDVYGFGIVLLEMLCARKNFDLSQPQESRNLLGVLQKCWEQETLQDMVDKYSEEMQAHGSEVVEMMKVASWCLQYDFMRRPSMSTVVKVLEGVMTVEPSLDYNFTDPRMQNTTVEVEKDMTPLLASVLSGPR
ncbi:G-type lectin S-receptor-like serine/threonine-protein kinase SD2-5 [Bidens hawaiensis]|uniref:G-type lectin S-receptor-like serine/threonine-protein kinase SD2-5 n=1 Tax=Bidens hawaiensis TaxID=980011 RepID=UPI00404B5682